MVYQRMMFILSIDEIRGLEDLPPLKIKGVTDVPWVQSGAMPLTTAAQPKAPVVRPPSGPPSSQDDPNARALSILQAATVMSIADDLAKAGNGRPDYDEEV